MAGRLFFVRRTVMSERARAGTRPGRARRQMHGVAGRDVEAAYIYVELNTRWLWSRIEPPTARCRGPRT